MKIYIISWIHAVYWLYICKLSCAIYQKKYTKYICMLKSHADYILYMHVSRADIYNIQLQSEFGNNLFWAKWMLRPLYLFVQREFDYPNCLMRVIFP